MKSNKPVSAIQIGVPILLPTGRDAALVARILRQQRIKSVICNSVQDLLVQIENDCGPFVVADEALSRQAADQLIKALQSQPDWSNVPGIILRGQYAQNACLSNIVEMRNLSLIQRPVRTAVFTNLIKTAIEARKRQFQVRDLLEEIIETNQKLRSRTDLLQKLTLELTRAENQERRRIAKILHDDLQPLLAAGKWHAELLFDDISTNSKAKVQKIHEIFSDAIQSSRSLSHELNPAFIIDGNLQAALRDLMTKMAEDYGFNTKVAGQIDSDRVVEEIQLFVYQSVKEMIFNCAKHAEATHLSLELKHQNKNLEVVLSDNGKGIETEGLKILGGNKGGFGLFSINERVTALGGSFKINSTPNSGCSIVLNVPVDPATLYIDEEPSAHDQPHARRIDRRYQSAECARPKAISVMIADDHTMVRQSMASLLQSQCGIEVIAEAADGEQAVILALQLRPDVLLMDISMPLMNGIEATRKIKAQAPDITIIGLSTFLDQSWKQQMFEAGAQEFLSKDIDVKTMLKKIRNALS